MEEIWKDIEWHKGSYKVSNMGRVYSIRRKKFKDTYLDKRGYVKVCLCYNYTQKIFSVHRLVAKAFIPNPNNYPQVNHKDENKQNNNVDNLEWCTKQENQNHAVRNNLMQHGQDRPSARLTEDQVLEIYKLKGILTGQAIADIYGVSKNTINCILRGSKWRYLYEQYFKMK